MPPCRATDPEWASVTQAIDLFVTGTDYDGRETTAVDSLGHPLDVKDHRRVFKLKFRADASSASSPPVVRRNDLAPTGTPTRGGPAPRRRERIA